MPRGMESPGFSRGEEVNNALQHQSQTEQYEFQFWNALRFGDYPKMCRAIAMMIRLAEGKNIDDINQELES